MGAARNFHTAVVLSAYTGRLFSTWEEMHDLMDHLYPGIMTIGVAAMQPTTAAELARQHPELTSLPPVDEPWRRWLAAALKELPTPLSIVGPHEVPSDQVAAAFDRFATRGPTENT